MPYPWPSGPCELAWRLLHRTTNSLPLTGDAGYSKTTSSTSGIVPEGAKSADAAVAVVGVIRSGSKPKVPVQPRGRISVRRIAHAVRPTVAVNPCFGKRDLPDFSAMN